MGNSGTKENKDDELHIIHEPNPQSTEVDSIWDHFKFAKFAYDQLVNAIIRPPRVSYPMKYLGLNEFVFVGKRFVRKDFDLINLKGQKLRCSHWEPMERESELLPCVVYLHGNSSNRLESLSELSIVLSAGATLFAFDFSGSGNSEGEYVSLGYFEKDDLLVVLAHLRSTGKTSKIGLWGRSMGAVTAILYASRYSMVDAMILDSSFSTFSLMTEDLMNRVRRDGTIIPRFIEYVLFKMVRQSVLKIAQFDIELLRPSEHVTSCAIPVLFCAASDDELISPQHTINLFERYGSTQKELFIENGNHNSPRSLRFKQQVQQFLHTHLFVQNQFELIRRLSFVDDLANQLPWVKLPINNSIRITEQQQKEIEVIVTNLVNVNGAS